MIQIKDKYQIEQIKIACKILAEVKQVIYDAIVPGITTLELDQIAHSEFLKRKAKPAFLGQYGFPNSICISINEELIHGIPSTRKIREGDIVKVDTGAIWNNYYSDSAFTKGVGQITKQDKKLIEVAKKAFFIGLDQIKPGARVGDIGYAVNKYVRSQNLFVPTEYTGHGIGQKLHEDPIVSNVDQKGRGPLLKDGMTICIEPMILQKNDKTIIKKDGWTVISKSKTNTSHYEHTILIENGVGVILTGGI